MKTINILVAGPAGTGLDSVAHTLALSFTREGLFAHTTSEYENRIRGGHNYSCVRISSEKILSHSNNFEVLIAMDLQSIKLHINEVKKNGIILFDASLNIEDVKKEGVNFVPVPILKLAEEAGLKLTANVVAVGALFAVLQRSSDTFVTVLESIFSKKGAEVVNMNIKALQLGYDYVKNNTNFALRFAEKGDKTARFLMNGNEAISLGCIKGGLKYLAAYPMTPGSTIMTTLAKESQKYDIVVTHVEDEIAALNMAIGGGYAGVRSATATSGGGFALMGEAISLAGMTEIPVVVFIAQRPGPSTGLATKTAQGDLNMAINCGQGDFPRLVIAAGNHEDCVLLTAEALNYAEKYQLPVIFLTDKYIADSYQTCTSDIADKVKIIRSNVADQDIINNSEKSIDGRFKRYQITKEGISLRSLPGMLGGEYVCNSYEHNEYGLATEDPQEIIEMMDKRQRKMELLTKNLPKAKIYGDLEKADFVFYVWGSTTNASLEAKDVLEKEGKNIAVVQMQYLYPFDTKGITAMFKNKKIVCIEANQAGQLQQLLKNNTGIIADFSIRKYDGYPISGEWILDEVRQLNLCT